MERLKKELLGAVDMQIDKVREDLAVEIPKLGKKYE